MYVIINELPFSRHASSSIILPLLPVVILTYSNSYWYSLKTFNDQRPDILRSAIFRENLIKGVKWLSREMGG